MSNHEHKPKPAGGLSAVDRSVGRCTDCEGPIGQDRGPPDGWKLGDGRTVCDACCAAELKRFADVVAKMAKAERVIH